MSNANTAHSKQMRRVTAAAYQKTITAANRLEIRNKDTAKIQAVKDKLAQIEGKDNCDKLLLVLDSYLKKQK
ncbi:hypothetical protein EGK75_09220 [Neisseria weixii]|uniref:Uncharacterized protein n=1 Tax=Neisseria weixii TaxID=1853276 RepID=A0A3N4NDA2_9NEIS|nr:hypothetical protein [Neisseria weixii]RPD86291.1 hypothetical protein EGK75_09220 [Neisseria weixii]RPD89389.1 hypothetical protein EGK74_03995 [Neisseria weixii]